MAWRLARALETLRAQVNEKWPNRSKNSDGSVGDVSHSSRASDHNPDPSGVVRAIDLTHDPKSGFDSYAFADLLLKNQDTRLKYVISNRRIGSGPAGVQPGVWRKYTGSNPHDHHCHISVVADFRGDNTSPWDIGELRTATTSGGSYVPPPPTLRKGSKGEDVKKLQALLHIAADGDFGPKTEAALKLFQKDSRLVADGIAGPMTWAALKSAA
jgi:hypothetical protein